MKLAVIGATGMIGHHTALAAVAADHDLTVVHRPSSDLSRLPAVPQRRRIAELGDTGAMIAALTDCDAVINCAGYYPTTEKPWQQEVEHAVATMRSFYTACAQLPLQKIVYLGSSLALPPSPDGYGDADMRYAEQPANKSAVVQVKWALDELALEQADQGQPVVIGIPSLTFGEYDWAPTTGRIVVEIANGNVKRGVPGMRNVLYAGDAGRGLVLAAERGQPGERYLFTNENVLTGELFGTIATAASTSIPRPVSLFIVKLVSRWQRLKHRFFGGPPPLLSETAIAVLAYGQFLDGSKAREELGFEPQLPFDQSIMRTVRWFRQQNYIIN